MLKTRYSLLLILLFMACGIYAADILSANPLSINTEKIRLFSGFRNIDLHVYLPAAYDGKKSFPVIFLFPDINQKPEIALSSSMLRLKAHDHIIAVPDLVPLENMDDSEDVFSRIYNYMHNTFNISYDIVIGIFFGSKSAYAFSCSNQITHVFLIGGPLPEWRDGGRGTKIYYYNIPDDTFFAENSKDKPYKDVDYYSYNEIKKRIHKFKSEKSIEVFDIYRCGHIIPGGRRYLLMQYAGFDLSLYDVIEDILKKEETIRSEKLHRTLSY